MKPILWGAVVGVIGFFGIPVPGTTGALGGSAIFEHSIFFFVTLLLVVMCRSLREPSTLD